MNKEILEPTELLKQKIKEKYNGVILISAGGGGTRLWPLSREKHPKQFVKLFNKKTLFRKTIERAMKLFDAENIFVSTNIEYENFVKEDFPELKPENLILESERRDHMPAICLAMKHIQKVKGNSIIHIAWADDLFEKEENYFSSVFASIAIAYKHKKLVRIGVKPTYPSIKYGYIQVENLINEVDGTKIFTLKQFKEKPTLEKAKEYYSRWDYFWNIGSFTVDLELLNNFYKNFQSETLSVIEEIYKDFGTNKFVESLKSNFSKTKKDSFEYGIQEKLNPSDVFVLPAEDIGWFDIGSWNFVYEVQEKNLNKNVLSGNGNFIEMKSFGNYINEQNSNKTIVTYGINDMTIIDTKDIILIIPTKETENLKEIIEEIKKRGEKELL